MRRLTVSIYGIVAMAAWLAASAGRAESLMAQDSGCGDVLTFCWTKGQLREAPGPDGGAAARMSWRTPPPGSSDLRDTPPLDPRLRNSIRRVRPFQGKKIVALTFDLCERAYEKSGYDAGVVECLREHGAKATFFAGGKWMRSHPERAMQLMADPLFEIGNHGWTHANLRLVKGDELERQILWPQRQYELLRQELLKRPCAQSAAAAVRIPESIRLFRFPYGTCSPESLQALARHGLAAIQWDVVTGDPSPNQTAEGIFRAVMGSVRPGSIIVCHANGRGHGTARAVAMLIPELRKRGYEFVTVSELLELGEAVAAEDCYENRPGDNAFYDTTVGAGIN